MTTGTMTTGVVDDVGEVAGIWVGGVCTTGVDVTTDGTGTGSTSLTISEQYFLVPRSGSPNTVLEHIVPPVRTLVTYISPRP